MPIMVESDSLTLSPVVSSTHNMSPRMQGHRSYGNQYMNVATLPKSNEGSFEGMNRTALEPFTEPLGRLEYPLFDKVNSTSSSNESIASSRDAKLSNKAWNQDANAYTKNKRGASQSSLPKLPKKGLRQTREDVFSKITSRDCV